MKKAIFDFAKIKSRDCLQQNHFGEETYDR